MPDALERPSDHTLKIIVRKQPCHAQAKIGNVDFIEAATGHGILGQLSHVIIEGETRPIVRPCQRIGVQWVARPSLRGLTPGLGRLSLCDSNPMLELCHRP